MVRSPRQLLALSFALLFAAGCNCGKERLIQSVCKIDDDCESGNLCENSKCVPATSKACTVVVDGNPILQPDPHTIAFGDLDTPEAAQTITLHNLGNCTLTVFEATLKNGADSAFTCEDCAADRGTFPLEIFPNRTRQLEIKLAAKKVGQVQDELIILSDDKEFSELRVPIHANFLGVPKLTIAPNPVDFGYVAQGREGKKQVQITNQGTGVAPIIVQSVAFDPADTQDFGTTLTLAEPLTLVPIASNSAALMSFEVQYHPRSTAKHAVNMLVTTSKGVWTVPVSGNSETPPKVTVSPPSIDLGSVELGKTAFRPLTIVNEGGAPLVVSYSWTGTNISTDLFAIPAVIPPIAPGAYVELQVGITATAVQTHNAMLLLNTNDPSKPAQTIPVTAEGIAGVGQQVVKIEMVYDTGSNSAFDEDIRKATLTLEHPYGYVCNKTTPAPTNWGTYGTPTWFAFGPKENPQRIILPDSNHDGTYRVMLQYLQDCKSLPSALAAGLLGISVDVLFAYLTGGISPVPGQDIGQILASVCLSHSTSDATVKAYVNGTLVMEKTITLNRTGDTQYAMDLVRTGGAFTAQ
ncbi:MAG: choice-of-anchor D domain-containing protein [Myxococcaceae bacterium]